MKTKMIGKAMAAGLMLLSINTGCVAGAQAPSSSKKLGYGFEPGLVSGKDYAAGQLIVGFREGADTQNIVQAASALGGQVAGEIQGSALLLQFTSEAAVEAAAPSLLARPDVVFVERNGSMSIPAKPELPQLKGRR